MLVGKKSFCFYVTLGWRVASEWLALIAWTGKFGFKIFWFANCGGFECIVLESLLCPSFKAELLVVCAVPCSHYRGTGTGVSAKTARIGRR